MNHPLALLFGTALALGSCTGSSQTDASAIPSRSSGEEVVQEPASVGPLIGLEGDTLEPLRLSDEAWAERLSEDAYYILRENGTERAFTSPLNDVKEAGMFVCAACQLPLFASETKFKSGTGWPSFYQPVRESHILELTDRAYGMVRTEVRCARCDGHQGHVFPDGPKPTGLRYCINGDALTFVPQTP